MKMRMRTIRIPWSLILVLPCLTVFAGHDPNFWKQIRANKFTVPPNESVDKLALELVDLTAEVDPVLRDQCGYEIFATWVYRDHRLNSDQLELLRRKLLPGMTFQIGRAEDDSIFRRSFSALFMSVLAAEDLQKPFLSDAAFNETLETALRCYDGERDLRGYVPRKGWAHATAHVADLLKFLGRNPKVAPEEQAKIVAAIANRCRTAGSAFVWGEDARMAAALLSLVNRKDFDPKNVTEWMTKLSQEKEAVWTAPEFSVTNYISIRNQGNVLVHLAARIDSERDSDAATTAFRQELNAALVKID